MHYVYSTSSIADAHIYASLLESAGIKATIHGESLQGALGGLPADDFIKISVADSDYVAARKIIEEAEALPDVVPTGASGFPYFAAFMWLMAGVAIGFALSYHKDIAKMVPYDSANILETDRNDDGKTDLTYTFGYMLDEFPIAGEADDNFDGRIDRKEKYARKGVTTSQELDQDFDGKFETVNQYKDSLLEKSKVDSDGNGEPDILYHYKNGQLEEITYLDLATGKPVKRDYYRNFLLHSADYDADRDGFLELHFVYDRYGQAIKTMANERD